MNTLIPPSAPARDRAVAIARLEERQRRGNDASEAGPDLYDDFARSFEEPDEWPPEDHIVVNSDRDGWGARLLEALL